MIIIIIILGLVLLYRAFRGYRFISTKYDDYPCYVVICQDGIMSEPMTYKEALEYNKIWYGKIFIVEEEKLIKIKKEYAEKNKIHKK